MKKTIAIFLLGAFMNLLVSCYSNAVLTYPVKLNDQSRKSPLRILSVKSKDGRIFEFNEKFPGWINDSIVSGTPQVNLNFGHVDSVFFPQKNSNLQIIWKDAKKYQVLSQDKEGFICLTVDTVSIPFSTISQINFKKLNVGKTVAFIAGSTALLVGAGVWIISSALSDSFSDMGGIW